MNRHKEWKRNVFLLYAGLSIAWQFLDFPIQVKAANKGDAAKGAAIFKKATCIQCHPGGGNVIMPQSPLKGEKFNKEFPTDESIAKVIRSGITGTPMQAFNKKRISDQELVDLIAYIRTFSKSTNSKPAK